MDYLRRMAWFMAASFLPGVAAAASFHGGHVVTIAHHHHHGGGGEGGGGLGLGFGVGAGWGLYGFPYTGVGQFPVMGPLAWPIIMDRGPLPGPMPPPRLPAKNAPLPVIRAKKADPAKSTQLVTIGDRLFRAGNLKRASERFDQAVRADPDAAAPRVRLAQIALVRGQFKDSAEHLRAAIAADPGFLANAPDIQAMYAEPADFQRQISKLESHVLLEPNDRDAWLVLGAELYLSGKTRRASDIFVRLSDRKPDPALEAFLDASSPPEK